MTALIGRLRDLFDCLSQPEPDWKTINDAWLDAAVEAKGTPADAVLGELTKQLMLRERDRLREGVPQLLEYIESGPSV